MKGVFELSGLTVGYLYDRCTTYYKDEIAIKYYDRAYTYGQVKQQAFSLSNALYQKGLKKGEKIAFLMKNCPEYIICEYALAINGNVRVPLAVLLGNNDHVYMMNQAECTTLIYHEKMAQRVKEMLPELKTVKHFVCVSDHPVQLKTEQLIDGHEHLQSMIKNHESVSRPVETDPEDLCGIYFTGGTTGLPKGVMLSHRAWVETVFLELLETGIEAREKFAYMTPLTHAGGCYILPVFLRKGTCVIMDQFSPKDFLETVQREQVTCTLVVPTMLYMLLDDPDYEKYDLSSLRNILYGAAAIAPERLKQAVDTFGPILTQFFGQTEAPMMISVLSRDDHIIEDPEKQKRVYASCGRPTMRIKVSIVGEDGTEVKTGEVGEVTAFCPNVMHGYLKNPEATAETLKDGWLYTGDLGKQDQEGFIYLVDRTKDMIVSGGFNIFPREVEDALFEHETVKNAAVVGVPHEKWGEAVKAIVVLNEGRTTTEDELIKFVKKSKGKLVAPKSVEFWDAIPVTNLGKVDKKKIREKYWAGKDRRI